MKLHEILITINLEVEKHIYNFFLFFLFIQRSIVKRTHFQESLEKKNMTLVYC
jgi:hypothetical protein